MITVFKGAIFDLDGVLVDTARYHYLAWKRLADELGLVFTERDNERLKGVSRMRSLKILLSMGNITLPEEKMQELAARKNEWYVASLQSLDASALLPGAVQYLQLCRTSGRKIALASASKNASFILDKLGIAPLFDVVVDGVRVNRAKPDPEVFSVAVEELGLTPDECVVFEDALAGVQAGHAAGCRVVAVGMPENLPGAEYYVNSLADLLS